MRDLKREATAQALAEAAFELTRERGLFGFVTADVVERAGYSRRTFANHFSCKEEAVAAVAFGGVDDASAILADLPDDLPLLGSTQPSSPTSSAFSNACVTPPRSSWDP